MYGHVYLTYIPYIPSQYGIHLINTADQEKKPSKSADAKGARAEHERAEKRPREGHQIPHRNAAEACLGTPGMESLPSAGENSGDKKLGPRKWKTRDDPTWGRGRKH